MKYVFHTFEIVATTVAILLLMWFLPPLNIDGVQLRKVDLLSDLDPQADSTQNSALLPPVAPKAPKPKVVTKSHKVINFKEEWPDGVEHIVDYGTGDTLAMDHFYEALAQVEKLDRPVRVAYFSDSFTEGDIFTRDLREQLQEAWGGYGAGWLDAGNPINKEISNVGVSYSSLDEHVTAGKMPFNESLQGLNQRYYTASSGSSFTVTGFKGDYHSTSWTVAQLLLRAPAGATVTVQQGGKSITSKVPASHRIQQVRLTSPAASKATFKLSGAGAGTMLLGAGLEGEHGVVVDNYSLRGSSGLTLGSIDAATLADYAKLRPYDLIVLHFGLNVADKGSSTGIMKYVLKEHAAFIANLRKAFPHASILVMSVTDHDSRSGGGIHTIKQVPQFVELQQLMAADQHVAFYNLFDAMGGEGSIGRLVEQHKAAKDYTHLSYGGGKLLAGKFFDSIKAGYKNYTRRKALEKQ